MKKDELAYSANHTYREGYDAGFQDGVRNANNKINYRVLIPIKTMLEEFVARMNGYIKAISEEMKGDDRTY